MSFSNLYPSMTTKKDSTFKALIFTGLYQICKYFLANLQIAKLHFANLHFTHPSFYLTFFVQTYNLPNTFCQTYIFQIFGKLTNFLHCAKSSYCQTFILRNPSVCSNSKNGAAIMLGQVLLSRPEGARLRAKRWRRHMLGATG